MIELKPMTRERRENIERWNRTPQIFGETIEELLAAEAFWREAVKNASVFSGRMGCPFCGTPSLHPPDCPVLLAQDGK